MDWFLTSIYHATAMFWETLWALVFGFTISGVLQVFISKEQMAKDFGKVNLRSMALATVLGAASSSCSYAAVAAARSAFQQGAAPIVVLAFMFASTNLVIELGAVLWLLIGWQFLLAEIIGALILIALVGFLELFCFRKIWKKKLASTSPISKRKAINIMVEVEMKTSRPESQMRS
jgi:uncharacterized membrane protein YraQ (UPF0718 family)